MSPRCLLLAIILPAALAHAIDLDREMILLPPTGNAPEDVAIATSQRRAAAAGATLAEFERLGWSFVAKARRTLDAGYYRLAEKTADVMDARFGRTPEADLLRGHVCHNLHRFHDAERIARRLVAERGMPEDWALLSDALMEQGDLREAIDALQRAENLKPGAEADTRIAHIRWLEGDLDGAIAAMIEALRATSPDDRASAAWILSRLSGFALQAGDIGRAGAFATAATRALPDYPPALLAAGRVNLARNRYPAAVDELARAERLNPLPQYEWWLADARRAAGDGGGARKVERALAADGAGTDPRTYALFLATRGENTPEAVRLARRELLVRRDVLTHDALAWALMADGKPRAAAAEMKTALAEGTRDPRLLLHAALIARANGQDDEARRFATECVPGARALLPSESRLLARLPADAGLRHSAPKPASTAAAVRRPQRMSNKAALRRPPGPGTATARGVPAPNS